MPCLRWVYYTYVRRNAFMESYLEVSFLYNICTLILSLRLGAYAAVQPISMRRMIMYATLLSALACFGWFPFAGVLVVLGEIVSLILFFRYALKTYVCAWILRLLLYGTSFVLYGGGFHNGMWFVPMDTKVIWLWIVYILLFIILLIKCKDSFLKLSYIYEITMYLPHTCIKLKSYLDSGNMLMYQQIPILFVDKKYQEYFKEQRIELVVMNSIDTTSVIRCYACDIKIAGCCRKGVYINCDRHLQLPFHCSVLLNVNVMTMG